MMKPDNEPQGMDPVVPDIVRQSMIGDQITDDEDQRIKTLIIAVVAITALFMGSISFGVIYVVCQTKVTSHLRQIADTDRKTQDALYADTLGPHAIVHNRADLARIYENYQATRKKNDAARQRLNGSC